MRRNTDCRIDYRSIDSRICVFLQLMPSATSETMSELVSNPNVHKAENQNVCWNFESDVQKEEHHHEKDEEPGSFVSWSGVHSQGVRHGDSSRVHV